MTDLPTRAVRDPRRSFGTSRPTPECAGVRVTPGPRRARMRAWRRVASDERRMHLFVATREHVIFRDADLPVFTILVPAYREANVVSKLIEHIGDLQLRRVGQVRDVLAADHHSPADYLS